MLLRIVTASSGAPFRDCIQREGLQDRIRRRRGLEPDYNLGILKGAAERAVEPQLHHIGFTPEERN